MTTLTKVRLHMLAGLLLSASAAWGQQLFGDHITGNAISCLTKHYNQHGATIKGYSLEYMVKAPACGLNGAATSSSTAIIGPPEISSDVVTTTAKAGDGANGTATAYDEAILTPPSGWTGPVTVELQTEYTFAVNGATSRSPGSYFIGWVIDDVEEKTESSLSNGSGSLNVAFPVVVQPSSDGAYEFSVEVYTDIDALGSATSAASVSTRTSFIYFALPEGWTCSWASNGASCALP